MSHAKAGARIAYVCPNYQMAKYAFDLAMRDLSIDFPEANYSQGALRVQMLRGAVYFRAADAEPRGHRYHLALVDHAITEPYGIQDISHKTRRNLENWKMTEFRKGTAA